MADRPDTKGFDDNQISYLVSHAQQFHGLSDFDTRNHVAGTAIYALPFKGNRLVSGYQLSTIVQYQTGNPVNITAGSSGYNGLTGVVRPNLVGHVSTHKSQTPVAGSASSFINVTFIPSSNVCPIGPTLAVPAGCSLQIQGTLQPTANAQIVYTGIGNIQRNAVTGPGLPSPIGLPSTASTGVRPPKVPVTNIYRDEIIEERDLPKKNVAYTPIVKTHTIWLSKANQIKGMTE